MSLILFIRSLTSLARLTMTTPNLGCVCLMDSGIIAPICTEHHLYVGHNSIGRMVLEIPCTRWDISTGSKPSGVGDTVYIRSQVKVHPMCRPGLCGQVPSVQMLLLGHPSPSPGWNASVS